MIERLLPAVLAAVLLALTRPVAGAEPEGGGVEADTAAGAPARPFSSSGPSPDSRPRRRLRFCAGSRTGNYTNGLGR
jgi:hypothetical protein